MSDLEILKFIAPLGVGGVLALVIFWFHHRAFLSERADRVSATAVLVAVVKDNTQAMADVAAAVRSFGDAMKNLERDVLREIEIGMRATEERRHG